MRELLLCIMLVASAMAPRDALAGAPPAAAVSPLAALQFLVGEWIGVGSGKPGETSAGGFTLAPDLDGKVLLRTSFAEYPARPGHKGSSRHDDRMVIFPEAGALKAIYFDNEGHVIRYLVVSTGKSVIFESEAAAPGPRFRLVYEAKGADTVSIVFSIAPPGSLAYRPYVTATARRK